MMQWLRDNAFLAGWLALPVTIFAAYAQNKGKPVRDVDWTWAIIYVTFGITLGVAYKKLRCYRPRYGRVICHVKLLCDSLQP